MGGSVLHVHYHKGTQRVHSVSGQVDNLRLHLDYVMDNVCIFLPHLGLSSTRSQRTKDVLITFESRFMRESFKHYN